MKDQFDTALLHITEENAGDGTDDELKTIQENLLKISRDESSIYYRCSFLFIVRELVKREARDN